MDASLLFFLLAVLVVAILVLITINLTKKHGAMFDKEAYQVNFLPSKTRFSLAMRPHMRW